MMARTTPSGTTLVGSPFSMPQSISSPIMGLGIGVEPQREWGFCGLGKAITVTHVKGCSANVLSHLNLFKVRRCKPWLGSLPSYSALGS